MVQGAVAAGDDRTIERVGKALAFRGQQELREIILAAHPVRNSKVDAECAYYMFPHLAMPDTRNSKKRPFELELLPILETLSLHAAEAVARHLTLCEALSLKGSFPEAAVGSHFDKSATRQLLDLAPPRTPAYLLADFQKLVKRIAKVLEGDARVLSGFKALRVPAPCLTGCGPEHALQPLFQFFHQLTSFSAVHGRVAYADPSAVVTLAAEDVVPILENLNPSECKHVCIDAIIEPGNAEIAAALGKLSRVTSLRLSHGSKGIEGMPGLEELALTAVTSTVRVDHYVSPQGFTDGLKAPESLKHVHISGDSRLVPRAVETLSASSGGVRGVWDAPVLRPHEELVIAGSFEAHAARSGRLHLSPVTYYHPMLRRRAIWRWGGLASSYIRWISAVEMESMAEDAAQSSAVVPGSGGPAALAEGDAGTAAPAEAGMARVDAQPPSAVAANAVRGRRKRRSANCCASGPGTSVIFEGMHKPPSLESCRLSQLDALGICGEPDPSSEMDQEGGNTIASIARQLLFAGYKLRLRELTLVVPRALPRRSPLLIPEDRSGYEPPLYRRCEYGWLSARPSASAHPICALELLHFAEHAPGGWSTEEPPSSAEPVLHTLRASPQILAPFQVCPTLTFAAQCMALVDLAPVFYCNAWLVP